MMQNAIFLYLLFQYVDSDINNFVLRVNNYNNYSDTQ